MTTAPIAFEPERDQSPRVYSVADLFPASGHRYLSDERVEELSLLARSAPGGRVSLNALTVIEIVCDLRNMALELVESSASGGATT